MANALELHLVSKIYEVGGAELVALDHVDLTLESDEVVTLLGPSGSGKTTLLSIAGGLLSPTSGRVVVGGEDVTRLSPRRLTKFRRERVGFIFQAVNLVPFLTARENLLVVAELARRKKSDAKARAERLLDELGLGRRLDNLPAQLSGGERQRVAIGRALMNSPELVLVDEPTSALDSDLGQQVMELIVSEVKARGAAAVVVTHDARITRFGDRILNMADGRIAGIAPRPEWTTHRPAPDAESAAVAAPIALPQRRPATPAAAPAQLPASLPPIRRPPRPPRPSSPPPAPSPMPVADHDDLASDVDWPPPAGLTPEPQWQPAEDLAPEPQWQPAEPVELVAEPLTRPAAADDSGFWREADVSGKFRRKNRRRRPEVDLGGFGVDPPVGDIVAAEVAVPLDEDSPLSPPRGTPAVGDGLPVLVPGMPQAGLPPAAPLGPPPTDDLTDPGWPGHPPSRPLPPPLAEPLADDLTEPGRPARPSSRPRLTDDLSWPGAPSTRPPLTHDLGDPSRPSRPPGTPPTGDLAAPRDVGRQRPGGPPGRSSARPPGSPPIGDLAAPRDVGRQRPGGPPGRSSARPPGSPPIDDLAAPRDVGRQRPGGPPGRSSAQPPGSAPIDDLAAPRDVGRQRPGGPPGRSSARPPGSAPIDDLAAPRDVGRQRPGGPPAGDRRTRGLRPTDDLTDARRPARSTDPGLPGRRRRRPPTPTTGTPAVPGWPDDPLAPRPAATPGWRPAPTPPPGTPALPGWHDDSPPPPPAPRDPRPQVGRLAPTPPPGSPAAPGGRSDDQPRPASPRPGDPAQRRSGLSGPPFRPPTPPDGTPAVETPEQVAWRDLVEKGRVRPATGEFDAGSFREPTAAPPPGNPRPRPGWVDTGGLPELVPGMRPARPAPAPHAEERPRPPRRARGSLASPVGPPDDDDTETLSIWPRPEPPPRPAPLPPLPEDEDEIWPTAWWGSEEEES